MKYYYELKKRDDSLNPAALVGYKALDTVTVPDHHTNQHFTATRKAIDYACTHGCPLYSTCQPVPPLHTYTPILNHIRHLAVPFLHQSHIPFAIFPHLLRSLLPNKLTVIGAHAGDQGCILVDPTASVSDPNNVPMYVRDLRGQL